MQRLDPLPHDARSRRYALYGDRDLVRRCVDRDRSALEELYRRHGAAVYSAATVMARRPAAPAADELTVAAFTAIWRDAPVAASSRRTVLGQLLAMCGREAASAVPGPAPARSPATGRA